METYEQTFRHSLGKLALMFSGVLLLGYVAFAIGNRDYFLITITGVAFIVALLYSTSSIRISSEGITTSRLFGSKSLRWTDVARISMRGQALRLHNHDEDVTLSIDSQLDGYKEILDIIFSKRPDLVETNENTVISGGWLSKFLVLGFGLFIMVISVFLFSVSEELDRIYSLIFFVLGVSVIVSWFLSPKSIALESRTLLVIYLFREISYSIEDIHSISLEKRRTRNGYIYFVQVNLKSGKKIKLPTFKQGAILTYQILKKWHEKANPGERTIFHNARI